MASEWPNTTIGEHVDLITGEAFQSALFETAPSDGVRLARGDNVKEGEFEWGEKSRFWPELTPDLERYLLSEADVLVGMDGSKVGKNWVRVRREDLPCLLVQRVARLRSKPTLHQRFLRYLIGNPMFRDYVGRVRTGTSIPHISGGQIKSYKFRLPPLAEQRAIASVLGALDDKIDLNRRMCQTLEEMARALFKSWFVDFDPVRAKMEGRDPGLPKEIADLFPSRLVNSELGPIPEGWLDQPLDEVADFLNGLALQKYPPRDGVATLPVLKIAQLKRGDTSSADRCSAEVPAPYQVLDGDLIFSWSGSLEVALWTGGAAALNQHLFKVTSDRFPRWCLYQWVCQHLPEFRQIAADKATTMGHIQRRHLSAARVAVPSKDVLRFADTTLGPITDRILAAQTESRSLASLRDTLLPKLISGGLRVPASLGSMQEVAT